MRAEWGAQEGETRSYLGLRTPLALARRHCFGVGLVLDISTSSLGPPLIPSQLTRSHAPCFPRWKTPWPLAKVGDPAREQGRTCVIWECIGFEVLRGTEPHTAGGRMVGSAAQQRPEVS